MESLPIATRYTSACENWSEVQILKLSLLRWKHILKRLADCAKNFLGWCLCFMYTVGKNVF